MEKCDLLRRVYDRPALTTDVIVGFPGETEEEFEASRRFVEQVRFFETHIFKYSRREGTRAAAMPGQISEQERPAEPYSAGTGRRPAERIYGRVPRRRKGSAVRGKNSAGRPGYWAGHTREYLKVVVPHRGETYENRMAAVKLVKIHGEDCVLGELPF